MKRYEFITKDIYKTIKDNYYWDECLRNISSYCTNSSYGGASLIPMDKNMQNWIYGSKKIQKLKICTIIIGRTNPHYQKIMEK